VSQRAEVLADRIAEGHRVLIDFIESHPAKEWRTYCPNEQRSVGVVVHHVAVVLPDELELIRTVASGQPVTGITSETLDAMNAVHAREYANCTQEETLDLLRRNSALVVAGVRAMSDVELDRAAPVSLHANTPVTAQYMIEDHPLSHAYQHLDSIRAAVDAHAEV
jgi:hypothetical protein